MPIEDSSLSAYQHCDPLPMQYALLKSYHSGFTLQFANLGIFALINS